MSRDVQLWLADIDEACARIVEYVADMPYDGFVQDRKTVDAVIRNLEIIGEAVKQLPEEFRSQHPHLPWRKIAGLRDVLAHTYFGIDEQIIWDIVITRVPELSAFVRGILSDDR